MSVGREHWDKVSRAGTGSDCEQPHPRANPQDIHGDEDRTHLGG